MKQVIVITGASSGFGRLSANALAKAGHVDARYSGPQRTPGRGCRAIRWG
jgi:NAD(P)-dependent dehydrogenase (short-subunit alcohol dehydrogenase family)